MRTIKQFIAAVIFLCAFFFPGISANAQIQIYSQNFSDSSGTLPPGWTNTGTCNWASSLSNPSTGYMNASGGKNAYVGSCTGMARMQVAFINTMGYDNIEIMWGARKTGSDVNTVEWSSDGSTWNAVSYTDVAGSSTWGLVNSGTGITLTGAGGFTNVRVRWTITNPTDHRLDDFSVKGTSVPTKLKISSVIGSTCIYPISGVPFTVNIVTQNTGNVQTPVLSNTTVQLSLVSGSLSGTTSGVILANTSAVAISGVIYNSVGSIQITATVSSGPPLTANTTNPIDVRGPITAIAFANVSGTGTTNNTFPGFRVGGVYSGGNPDSSCFSGSVTISVNSVSPAGGTITGTLTQIASGGSAQFNNVVFTQAGTYTLKAVSSGYADIISSPIVITDGAVMLTDIRVPLYMEGKSPVNNERLLTACLVEIKNLIPGNTYKYYNRVVVSGEPGVDGTGNTIFANAGGFTRTTNPNFTSAPDHSTFIAGPNGRYTGWFVVEPDQDARFTPGNDVYMRIMLNDGLGGTAVVNRLTATHKTRVLELGPGATQGSFIGALPPSSGYQPAPKNFLLLYKGDTTGTGNMPVSITVVENDGLNVSSLPYLPGYISGVDGINFAAGTIIPDQNPSGITRIEEFSLTGPFDNNTDNSVPQPVSVSLAPSGIWPPGVDTRNPTNGTTPIVIQPVYVLTNISSTGTQPENFKLYQNYPNPFNPVTKIKFDIPASSLTKVIVYDMLGKEIAMLVNDDLTAGSYSIDWDASSYPSGMYFYKLSSGNFTQIRKMALIK